MKLDYIQLIGSNCLIAYSSPQCSVQMLPILEEKESHRFDKGTPYVNQLEWAWDVF